MIEFICQLLYCRQKRLGTDWLDLRNCLDAFVNMNVLYSCLLSNYDSSVVKSVAQSLYS